MHQMVEDRPAVQFHEWLGNGLGKRPQPFAFATAEQHRRQIVTHFGHVKIEVNCCVTLPIR